MAYRNTSARVARRRKYNSSKKVNHSGHRRASSSEQFRVFISYAHGDKLIAEDACAIIENSGVRCWMASRDIGPGMDYATALFEALQKCSALVLIFSRKTNDSPHINREVEVAASRGILLIPVRIEDAQPSPALRYFANSVHWLEALTPPLRQHLATVITTLRVFRRRRTTKRK
jgi:hypothetical protein